MNAKVQENGDDFLRGNCAEKLCQTAGSDGHSEGRCVPGRIGYAAGNQCPESGRKVRGGFDVVGGPGGGGIRESEIVSNGAYMQDALRWRRGEIEYKTGRIVLVFRDAGVGGGDAATSVGARP